MSLSIDGQLAATRFELASLYNLATLFVRLDTAAPAMGEAELRDALSTIADVARQRLRMAHY